VLVLSRETGQDVRAADGRVIGKLRDLTVRLDVEHPVVYRLAIGSRRRLVYLVPWTAVAAFERSEVQLRDVGPLDRFLIGRGEIPLEEDELLLVRDVLDTQIIDVVGQSRVSDVVITRLADGRLEVAAVDVSGAAVWRRLGLRWFSERFGGRAVDWRDLHLTSARGHDVHLATTTAAMHQLDAKSLAELLTRLDLTSATEIVKAVGPVRAAGAVARTHPVVGRHIMLALESQDAAKVIDELPREADAHYRQVVGSRTPLTRRRFRRLHGWRLRRPPATTSAACKLGREDDRGVDR
jgi:hypothetical protein